VVALADVFRRFAEDYLSTHGASVLPSHRRAIADILACRTHALGGHLWRCNHCSTEVYSYHSCKNRSCPRCHKDQTERWIAARNAELLACPYFHVTVTVPAELRETLRANQRDGYAALMKATAEAIIELARDRRHVGGTVVRLGEPGVRLNPLDLPANQRRPDMLTRRGLFLHTLVAVMLGADTTGGQPLAPAEKAALDRAIIAAYTQAGITSDPATWSRPAPLLRDLASTLDSDADPAAATLAARLSPWTTGNFSDLFAGPTTTRPAGHLVVWSLRQLPDELRGVGTLLALDAIWRDVDTPPTRAGWRAPSTAGRGSSWGCCSRHPSAGF